MSRLTDAGYALVEIYRYIPHPLDGPDWGSKDLPDSAIEHEGAVYEFTALGESHLQSELSNYCSAVDHFEHEMQMLAPLFGDKSHIVTVWKQICVSDGPDWTGEHEDYLSVEFVGVADMGKLLLLVEVP